MAVAITLSETLDGAAVSDVMAGVAPPETGVDLGNVINGSFTPVTDKGNNQGHQDLFVSHDGVNEITDVGTFVQPYETGTGNSYGGAKNATDDFSGAVTGLVALGDAVQTSKNNADGLSGGLWIDMDWDGTDGTRFEPSNGDVYIYKTGVGIELANAVDAHINAMVYNNAGETAASAAETGKIGPAANTVLGDAFHFNLRWYLPTSHPDGGIIQFEYVIKFSATN